MPRSDHLIEVSFHQGLARLVWTASAAAPDPQTPYEDQDNLLKKPQLLFFYINNSFASTLKVAEKWGVAPATLHWDLYQTQHEILKSPAQRGI